MPKACELGLKLDGYIDTFLQDVVTYWESIPSPIPGGTFGVDDDFPAFPFWWGYVFSFPGGLFLRQIYSLPHFFGLGMEKTSFFVIESRKVFDGNKCWENMLSDLILVLNS